MSRTDFHDLQGFNGLHGLHDGLRSPDAESLRSFTETIQDEYHEWVSESGRISRTDQLLDNFPQPPRSESLDAIEEEEMEVYPTPKPSIKNLRRHATANDLPLLQQINPNEGAPEFNPVSEENGSYDLIAPYDGGDLPLYKLERIADIMFSSEHMLTILNSPRYLARFRDFLLEERPRSISTLTYYLNACKALKAIQYANALVRLSVDVPPPVVQTDGEAAGVTVNRVLEQRVVDGLLALTAEELPAFITSRCITITSKIVEQRIRGSLPMKFRGTSNALAEVFCLTDPSRPDNPIIFASEEFHRTTQYGMDYVLGRNCRFLQGPKTNANSVRRLREAIHAGRHHSEMFLNYRRDGSPFMNLLQCAPLCDSHGRVKYFIGAQIDVSGLAMEGASMESLMELQHKHRDPDEDSIAEPPEPEEKDEFRELTELFSPRELSAVQQHGGHLFQPAKNMTSPHHPRSWLQPDVSLERETEAVRLQDIKSPFSRMSFVGVYENYLLVRPYPSLRILFTSPALQIPGMLQSPFLSRIGSSSAVKDDLLQAMKVGRSVTARIKWATRSNPDGRNRWVHCTPLLASNGQVGVWMVVVVDDG
ncbi:PAS-associated, C-terminal [Penicillium expansum]|uniref:PAS-associated, C-terminal n=1 Tax=Penicillium expansum TaxID=27334 RepID=A0A0A2I144_PENEN|nr:PAS-associated, C-terminal [Penicillium expansum]KGO36198.1 PAS-associated, C-terminal [Penicillium expansum]KGO44412.1 PAS-associated, C-terminal [Penicillium expansum]KGO62057.1 PAS-associated, C-terminal [Penicillium expansum]